MKGLLLIVFALLQTVVFAQYEQDIISIGDRKLTIREAYKIKDLPTYRDTIVSMDSLNYSVITKLVPTSYEAKDIKAAKVKVQTPLKRLYRGYVKAGVGTYTTPLLSIDFNSLRSRKIAYGIHAHHLSSNGGIKDYAHSGYALSDFGGWFRKALKKHSLEFGANYDSDKVHYYGFKPQDYMNEMELTTLDIDDDDILHRLRSFDINSTLKSFYRDSTKVSHVIEMAYRHSKDNFGAREGNFLLTADLNTFKDKFKFMLKTTLDINNYTSDRIEPFDFMVVDIQQPPTLPVRDNNAILEFAPQINAVVGRLRANIGIGVAFDIDNTTAIRFFPRGFAKYSLFNDLFTVYAGVDGGLERNSYHSLFKKNPFIRSQVTLRNTYNRAGLYTGIRGSITKELSFNTRLSTRSFSELPLFVNLDTLFSVENRFDVIYAKGSRTDITGELTYQQSEKLRVFTGLELTTYHLDGQEKAWHLPSRKINVGASFNMRDKFIITADIYSEGKRYAQTYDAIDGVDANEDGISIRTLKGYVDGNLKFEYNYTKRVSAFLQFNNISGGKYQRWNNYPVQRLMIMGGLSYSF